MDPSIVIFSKKSICTQMGLQPEGGFTNNQALLAINRIYLTIFWPLSKEDSH